MEATAAEVIGEKRRLVLVRKHVLIVDLRGLATSQILDGNVMRLVSQLTHINEVSVYLHRYKCTIRTLN